MKIRSAFILSVWAAILASVTLTSPAFAQNSQQSKMAACNQQADDKKGDDRKAFMKDCLSKNPLANAKPMTPQERMTTCNHQAADKKGDDRKVFMKDCLSNKG
jgi:hypothetical protein